MLMNTSSCSLPIDRITCVTMRSSLIYISHFSAEPAPERFDARDLSAVVSFDSEGTPSLSMTIRVGSHKPTPLQPIAVKAGMDLGILKGGGHIAWVYMYMEKSDGAYADADSYTCTQTE